MSPDYEGSAACRSLGVCLSACLIFANAILATHHEFQSDSGGTALKEASAIAKPWKVRHLGEGETNGFRQPSTGH